MRWLTNVHEAERTQVMIDLCYGYATRMLSIGEPQETRTYDVSALKRFGMVGIYEHTAIQTLRCANGQDVRPEEKK